MAKQDIATAVAEELEKMGVETISIDRSRKHPRVMWADRGSVGIITVPSTASDHRSLMNNVAMARRLLRQARGE